MASCIVKDSKLFLYYIGWNKGITVPFRNSIGLAISDDNGKNCGAAVFENHRDKPPPAPIGDYKAQTATTYMDLVHYAPFMEILRLEKPIFMKIAWMQTGPNKVVSDVSLDTKQEIIGEYFTKNDG